MNLIGSTDKNINKKRIKIYKLESFSIFGRLFLIFLSFPRDSSINLYGAAALFVISCAVQHPIFRRVKPIHVKFTITNTYTELYLFY